jgi:putative flippase GtrA
VIASIKLAIRYAILAGVATVANIASQEGSLRLYQEEYSIPLSVFVGTLVGLFVKYVLDKRFIFRFKAKNRRHDGGIFILYTVMGLLTTVIFWGTEFLFQYLYGTREMRYLGGVIGLTLGYLTKYQLDKRYVFRVSSR